MKGWVQTWVHGRLYPGMPGGAHRRLDGSVASTMDAGADAGIDAPGSPEACGAPVAAGSLPHLGHLAGRSGSAASPGD